LLWFVTFLFKPNTAYALKHVPLHAARLITCIRKSLPVPLIRFAAAVRFVAFVAKQCGFFSGDPPALVVAV